MFKSSWRSSKEATKKRQPVRGKAIRRVCAHGALEKKVFQEDRSAQLYQFLRYDNKEALDHFQKSVNEIGKDESLTGMGFRVEWCR